MTVLAEPLTRLLGEQAPGCTVALDPIDVRSDQFEAQLMRRDLIIGPLGFEFPGRLQPVFTDELVCLVARDHPRLKDGALTLDDLQAMPHAVAQFAAAGQRRRPLEVELDAKGVQDRTVLVQVTSLLTLPFAVAGTDMCAFVPSRLAMRCLDVLGLAIAETPLDPGDDHRGRALAPAPREGPGGGVVAPAALRRGDRAGGRARLSLLRTGPTAEREAEGARNRHHQRRHHCGVLAAQPDEWRDQRPDGERRAAQDRAPRAGHRPDQ